MQASAAYIEGMKTKQYTIRGVPEKLDGAVREEAHRYRKSMNALLLEALARGLGIEDDQLINHDMDDLVGTWVEDEEFDRAIAAFEVVDEDLW